MKNLKIIFTLVLTFFITNVFSAQEKQINSQDSTSEPRESVKKFSTVKEPYKEKVMQCYWNNGLYCESKNRNFIVKIGGRLQFDVDYFEAENSLKDVVGSFSNGVELRRARFYMKGVCYQDYFYKLEYDFASGNAQLKDGFIGLQNIKYVGQVQVGHMLEPFSLENLESNNFSTFMEYALPVATFSHFRNDGVKFNNSLLDDKITWDTGIFKNADDYGEGTTRDYSWSTRITFLPYYSDMGRKLFHFGGSCNYHFTQQSTGYSAKPEANMAPVFVNTGTINSRRETLAGGEVAFNYGCMSAQGEYICTFVNKKNNPNSLFFYGYYGYVSFFLTGENRPFNKKLALFERVLPKKNFSVSHSGMGAWEIAFRYSYVDLTDNNISGGKMDDFTFGLNWYMTPNIRVMGNYIYSHLHSAGNANIFLARMQVDF
jgi:phosphate-selective porin OprO and OprP